MGIAELLVSVSDGDDSARPRDVLIVEDEPAINEILQIAVELVGLTARTAFDGREALCQIRRRMPVLVVLDLHLPDVDGLAILRELRTNPATRSVPVIVVSAMEPKFYEPLARQAGCDEYLVKPFALEALASLIQKHLDEEDLALLEPTAGYGARATSKPEVSRSDRFEGSSPPDDCRGSNAWIVAASATISPPSRKASQPASSASPRVTTPRE